MMRQEEHGGGRKELPFVAITQTGFYFSKASLCLRHFFGGGGWARHGLRAVPTGINQKKNLTETLQIVS